MNLSQLEVLIAIVETGNFTDAAEFVGLTQSAVSYSLSKLEAELGVYLMERGRQGITLTPIGKEMVLHARRILNEIEIMRQKAARERGLTVGKLRFGCVPTIPSRLLTGILRDFSLKYPDIDLVLFEGTPPELVDWLSTGVIDVGTVATADGFLTTMPFVHDEIRLIVSTSHSLATLAQVSLEQLRHEPLIGPKIEYSIMSKLLRRQNLTIPRLRYEVSTQSTVFSMVRENLGVALVLKMALPSNMDSLVDLPLNPAAHVDIFLGTNSNSIAAREFMVRASNWAKEHRFLLI